MSVTGSSNGVSKLKATLQRGSHFGTFSQGNNVLLSTSNILPCPTMDLKIPVTLTVSIQSLQGPLQMTFDHWSPNPDVVYPHCNSIISTWWNINSLKFYFATHHPHYQYKVVRKVSLKPFDKLVQDFAKAACRRKMFWLPDIDNLHRRQIGQVRLCQVAAAMKLSLKILPSTFFSLNVDPYTFQNHLNKTFGTRCYLFLASYQIQNDIGFK